MKDDKLWEILDLKLHDKLPELFILAEKLEPHQRGTVLYIIDQLLEQLGETNIFTVEKGCTDLLIDTLIRGNFDDVSAAIKLIYRHVSQFDCSSIQYEPIEDWRHDAFKHVIEFINSRSL